MKVLHLINTLSAGGAELHLLSLCRHLKEFGVETLVGYLKEDRGSRFLAPDFGSAGIRVFRFGANIGEFVPPMSTLRCLLMEEKPHVLHTHLPRADLFGFLAQLSGFSGSWICSVHDIYSRSWRGQWSIPLFSYIWRRANAVIAISYAVKDWLERRLRIPSEKIYVVHYGIEGKNFLRKDKRNPNDELIIGSIGRLEHRKGHDTLIRAMPKIVAQFPKVKLFIGGHDPWGFGKRLKHLISELGLHGNVHLIGFVDDVTSFLHSIDVFAFASRSEGFGQVLIEAMAAGRPVVASRISPITEIVEEGVSGLLVPPDNPEAFANAILCLLKNPQKACMVGEKGRQRVRDVFTAETMVRKTLEVYTCVIEGNRTPRTII